MVRRAEAAILLLFMSLPAAWVVYGSLLGWAAGRGKPTMTDYSWVPWFKELVGKIANNDHAYLIKKAKAVDWGKDDVALLKYGDENIDPLSFLYFLAQKAKPTPFKRTYPSVHEIFGIQAALPEPEAQLMIPMPPAIASALFGWFASFFSGLRI